MDSEEICETVFRFSEESCNEGLNIQSHQQDVINLHRDIVQSMSNLGFRIERFDKEIQLVDGLPLFGEQRGSVEYLGDSRILGIEQNLNRHQPHSLDEVIDWELIVKNLFSYTDLNPRRRIGSSLKEGFADIVRDVMEVINSYSKQRGRIIDFKEILYGYWRLDPLHGVDLIMDLLLVYRKYRGHKMTVQVRRHAYVQQTFTGITIREIDHFDNELIDRKTLPVHRKIVNTIISQFEKLPSFLKFENTKEVINFIVPLSGRFDTLERFLKMYQDVCIDNNENTHLILVLYNSNDLEKTKKLLENYQYRNGFKSISVIRTNETFARARALEKGINLLTNDSLIFFIDIDIIFNSNTLQRIRSNTIRNSTIYFPIVFSLYNPKTLNQTYPADYKYYRESMINQNYGFWRQFGFGIVSLYKIDYIKLGGLNLEISGWGAEDVAFYDNVIKSNLRIFRTIDPGLIHVYHPISCDNLDVIQKNMCLGTQASMLGSLQQLERLYVLEKSVV